MQERLQKILAKAGYGSRRKCEEIILQDRVTINGEIANQLGVSADIEQDTISVDGRDVQFERKVYVLLNKPAGYITSCSDPRSSKNVISLLRGVQEKVYPAGRLDIDTTGVLLLSNDGELTLRLTHPRYGIEKKYRVVVKGIPRKADLVKLADGVLLEDGMTKPCKVKLTQTDPPKNHATIEIAIHEGKNRQVKRMLYTIGYPVIALERIEFGGLTVKDLKTGQWRRLSNAEVETLKRKCGL